MSVILHISIIKKQSFKKHSKVFYIKMQICTNERVLMLKFLK